MSKHRHKAREGREPIPKGWKPKPPIDYTAIAEGRYVPWNKARQEKSAKLALEAGKALRSMAVERTRLPARWEDRARTILKGYIRESYLPFKDRPDVPLSDEEIDRIAARTTIGTVVNRYVSRPDVPRGLLEKYRPVTDKRGNTRWYRRRDGKRVSRQNLDRARGMLAYWETVRILKQSTGWDTKKARAAVKALSDDPFLSREVTGSP